MAEPRRLHLTTTSRYGSAASVRDRPADTDTDTVRLVLTLFEPDERSFSEFSYTQLVGNKVGSDPDKTQQIN